MTRRSKEANPASRMLTDEVAATLKVERKESKFLLLSTIISLISEGSLHLALSLHRIELALSKGDPLVLRRASV